MGRGGFDKQVKYLYLDFAMFFADIFLNNSNHSDATCNQSNYQEMRNINKNENFQRNAKPPFPNLN